MDYDGEMDEIKKWFSNMTSAKLATLLSVEADIRRETRGKETPIGALLREAAKRLRLSLPQLPMEHSGAEEVTG
jgi:hypothetical protein